MIRSASKQYTQPQKLERGEHMLPLMLPWQLAEGDCGLKFGPHPDHSNLSNPSILRVAITVLTQHTSLTGGCDKHANP